MYWPTQAEVAYRYIAYTQNIRIIKQLKQLAKEGGDINIARHFGKLKEGGNITFEQQSVVLVDSIYIIHPTVLLTRLRSVL